MNSAIQQIFFLSWWPRRWSLRVVSVGLNYSHFASGNCPTNPDPDWFGINRLAVSFKPELRFDGPGSLPVFSSSRLAELLPFVDVNRRWGIISKCLTYSKAASDPFAYSLLRQQYKKVLVAVVNRLLRRDLYPSSGHNSSLDTENDYCLQRIS